MSFDLAGFAGVLIAVGTLLTAMKTLRVDNKRLERLESDFKDQLALERELQERLTEVKLQLQEAESKISVLQLDFARAQTRRESELESWNAEREALNAEISALKEEKRLLEIKIKEFESNHEEN